MMPPFHRQLVAVGAAHVVVAVVCLLLLRVDAAPVLSVHPAVKPLKFASSIAVFLFTMALLLPTLSIGDEARGLFAGALSSSMILEMAIIALQALRGRRSHFNLDTPLDALLTRTMIFGIFVLLLAMIPLAVVATTRPLAAPPLLTWAWRAALWIFLFSAVSGVGMGGRGRHSIGGDDGGPGLPLTHWSSTHGDLRVSHFFAVHVLQSLPLLAVLLSRVPLGAGARWALLGVGIGTHALVAGWTWIQALGGRPFR